MPEAEVFVFFYGSYMNRAVLAEVGLTPTTWEVASLPGFDIRIARRANLLRAAGRMCSASWLPPPTASSSGYAHARAVLGEVYLPEAVLAHTESGAWRPASATLRRHMAEKPPTGRTLSASCSPRATSASVLVPGAPGVLPGLARTLGLGTLAAPYRAVSRRAAGPVVGSYPCGRSGAAIRWGGSDENIRRFRSCNALLVSAGLLHCAGFPSTGMIETVERASASFLDSDWASPCRGARHSRGLGGSGVGFMRSHDEVLGAAGTASACLAHPFVHKAGDPFRVQQPKILGLFSCCRRILGRTGSSDGAWSQHLATDRPSSIPGSFTKRD